MFYLIGKTNTFIEDDNIKLKKYVINQIYHVDPILGTSNVLGTAVPVSYVQVEFAKRVPGFCDLGQDDQLILIKIGFFEIWLTHSARLTTVSSMMFDDGTTFTRQQLETMYDGDFVSSLIHFASTFNALSLNDTEVGLFSAAVLLTADRPGVSDVKAIERYQDRIVEALKVQVGRNHANEPQIFSNLLIKLPELRNLGAKHSAHLDWFRSNWTKLTLPPLFAEIFDIPKTEDDLQ
ncbi:unnamed protein product [Acanthoscelides obtectus]|uniref:NR LBD domain-containing protein n=1 Tax=Acanthoscelides obtectus TaxID=200917 RepID=A0A9P0MB68_ACAOB|nr:unnamed protein product [Acanthoscelides obtectus]CAK1685723.1 Ecdysone-induced protein 78C [Acanthoscelides obtectus]